MLPHSNPVCARTTFLHSVSLNSDLFAANILPSLHHIFFSLKQKRQYAMWRLSSMILNFDSVDSFHSIGISTTLSPFLWALISNSVSQNHQSSSISLTIGITRSFLNALK